MRLVCVRRNCSAQWKSGVCTSASQPNWPRTKRTNAHQFASEIVFLTTDKCVSQCSVCLKLLALRRDLLTSTNRRATAASQLSAVNVDRKYCAVCVSEYENWLGGKDSDVFDVQSHTLQSMASTKGMRSDTIDKSKISHNLLTHAHTHTISYNWLPQKQHH